MVGDARASGRTLGTAITVLEAFRVSAGGRSIPLPYLPGRILALLAVHGGPMQLDDVAAAVGTNPAATIDPVRAFAPGMVVANGGRMSLDERVAVDLHDAIGLAVSILDGETDPGTLGPHDIVFLASDLLPSWTDPWLEPYRERWDRLRTETLRTMMKQLDATGRARPMIRSLLEAAGWDLARLAALAPLLPGARTAHGEGDRGGSLPLSPREKQVASLIAEGLTNREIAARLVISERTVDAHAEHIRTKLGVRSRVEIASRVPRSSHRG